jgi:imidazolonepropionase-like amidohydrolase
MVAIHSGVDVLAHAPDTTEGIDDAVLKEMVQRHMAMIPTLKMFEQTVTTKPEYLQPIYDEVRRFHELGGELMFGTDVGYMHDYRTVRELIALSKSGLSAMDILRMLTTTPARRFGVLDDVGTLGVGKVADFVVLERDPTEDVAAFAWVAATVRHGEVVSGL